MSKRIRKIFKLSKKDKDQGDQPGAAHSSGQSTPDPSAGSQPTLHPHSSHQPTPDPLSSGTSTPNFHSIDQHSTNPYPGGQRILEPPSRGQRIREGAIVSLDFISAISEATDLLKPLKAACGAVKIVLQKAKDIDQVNENWKELIKRLNFHLATVENHLIKLEEDQETDGNTPILDRAIREPLETYAKCVGLD